MKIDPGYYKIRHKESHFGKNVQYMRVFVKEGVKYFQIDHGSEEKAADREEDIAACYDILKRITKPITINRLSLTLNWTDEDGDEFKLTARNSYVLNRIFELFPRLKKAWEG